MNQRAIEKTELNKILALVSEYAVTDGGKAKLTVLHPSSDVSETKKRLCRTEESVKLLFQHGISKVEYFPPFFDEIERAKKGSALTCGELLKAENLLRSARIAHKSIAGVNDEEIKDMKSLADRLYFDENPPVKRAYPRAFGRVFDGRRGEIFARRHYYNAR